MINLNNFKQETFATTLDLDKQQNLFSLTSLEDREFFTKEYCNDVKELSKLYPLEKGLSRTNSVVNYRDSDVSFLPYSDNVELYEKVGSRAKYINDKFLKFDITHLGRLQYSKYSENQFLDSHDDDYFKYYYTGNESLLQRKLSISILLSDPYDYEGGEFEVEPNILTKSYSTKPDMGAAIFFPSFLVHRVRKVTKGIRQSLVCWLYGPAWR